MIDGLIIGIDTSNYTTSVALLDTNGTLVANIKRPLPVAEGECGLRQSDAVFAHIKNMPSAMDELRNYLGGRNVLAVGVSKTPRNIEGSYMPCFLAGVAVAESISAVTSAPIFDFSHQCGHIMAAIYSSGSFDLLERQFAAFHISGGTTELLSVSPADRGFAVHKIGGTKDLNAGQIIDRVGVMMGLPFPCGKHIEALALGNTKRIPAKKISSDGGYVNLSGLENIAKKLYSETFDKALVSKFVIDFIARCIEHMTEWYLGSFGEAPIVYAGGVMSNSIIKDALRNKFDARFAEPSLSADNAVGIAYLAYREYLKQKNISG